MSRSYAEPGPAEEIAAIALEEFGSDATYYPADGAPFGLRVIFRDPHRDIVIAAGGIPSQNVSSNAPWAKAPRSVLSVARQGETLQVAGEFWEVVLGKPDATVWTLLMLQGPIGDPRT